MNTPLKIVRLTERLLSLLQRGNLNNPDNANWFNIFNVVFEIVSAYGTVGLSLGVGFDNFSYVS